MVLHRARSALRRLRVVWHTSRYRFPDGYRRVYHHHVRKSAGTSLNAAFWALAGLSLEDLGRDAQVCRKGLVFVRHSPALIHRGEYFFANSHNPAWALELPPRTFTITILRDPLKRLLSYYRYLRFVATDPGAAEVEPFYDEVRREAEVLGDDFQDFLRRLPPPDRCHQLHMFSEDGDVQEAVERVRSCAAVCLTERFADDLAMLRRRLQLPLEERRDRAFGSTLDLTEGDLAQARDLLAPEYRMMERVHASATER